MKALLAFGAALVAGLFVLPRLLGGGTASAAEPATINVEGGGGGSTDSGSLFGSLSDFVGSIFRGSPNTTPSVPGSQSGQAQSSTPSQPRSSPSTTASTQPSTSGGTSHKPGVAYPAVPRSTTPRLPVTPMTSGAERQRVK